MREKAHHKGQEQVRPHFKALEPEKSDSQEMSDLECGRQDPGSLTLPLEESHHSSISSGLKLS